MNNNEEIENSILRVLTGNDTEYDRKIVGEWSRISDANRYKIKQLGLIWKESTWERKLLGSEDVKKKVWQKGTTSQEKAKIGIWYQLHIPTNSIWLRAAVVLLVVAIISVFVLSISQRNKPQSALVEAQNITVKSNPPGQKSKVFLPDGSIVWLNAESTIQYIENFSDSSRVVELDGEAYFEIKRDTLTPFTVKVKDLNVRVLGTKFNINAFESNGEVTVALTEGSVEVGGTNSEITEHLLKGGQGVHYRPGVAGSQIQRFEFSTDDSQNPITGWKDGILIFDGDDFASVVKKIKRWYGVEVEVKGNEPKDWNIRASFQEEYLSNVLASICINKKFDFSLDRKKLVFVFN